MSENEGNSENHTPQSTDIEVMDQRDNMDRRQKDNGPPLGVERRQWQDRRKIRSKEGRERYLDMVQKERSLLAEMGVSRSTDQLLDMAGAVSLNNTEAEDEGVKLRATGDQLRAILPVQAWLPLSIHLIGLQDGVLKIAPLEELNEKQQKTLVSTAARSGFQVN
ncbi:MAG TPA: type II/IV secretion system family protein, partial [Alphaproteobacteria bacterium]|nr:type II/IV secretion system family protein [Alphaproteobacteria bacterium]